MPDDLSTPMSDAALRTAREHLGLTIHALAALLDVDVRTVRRWEVGTHRIPDGVRDAVEDLEREAVACAADVLAALRDTADPTATPLVTWRSDRDFWAAHPERRPRPAAWHRAVLARVTHVVPGLTIDYASARTTP